METCVLLRVNRINSTHSRKFSTLTIDIESSNEWETFYSDLTSEFDENFETTPDETNHDWVSIEETFYEK